jgi:hypothetical protein
VQPCCPQQHSFPYFHVTPRAVRKGIQLGQLCDTRLQEADPLIPPARAGPDTDVILAGCGCYVVL